MGLQAVIFDLDGTIADTIPLTLYSIGEVAKKLTGRVYTEEEILKEFGPVDTEIIRKLVDNEKRNICENEYVQHFREHFDDFVKPIDGIGELLGLIKARGMKTGLFTGRSLRLAEVILEKLSIRDCFDVIIAGEYTKRPKPDPEGILLALKELNVPCSNGLYIGDFDADIKASKSAGVTAALALWSSTKNEALIELQPDVYFRSPYEFIEWFDKE